MENSNNSKANKQESPEENLYFAVYCHKLEAFQHIMVYRESEKSLELELRKNGCHVHYVFSRSDVEDIKRGHLSGTDASEDVVAYLVEHIGEWDMNF